jgi:glutathione S-transferase
MELYFSPMACSLASRISFYEAGAAPDFVEVDRVTKKLPDGGDYHETYALGLVPLLRLESGELITENMAVLQYIAARHPQAELAPTDELGRARLQQWLGFIGTELHKAMFIPLFDRKAPDGTRAHTLNKYRSRLDYLDRHLTGREFLLDRFSVADAYLVTILNWTAPTEVDLAPWPALKDYYKRMRARPAVAKAIAEEYALYQAEQARHAAA